jgi:hypothetical protein
MGRDGDARVPETTLERFVSLLFLLFFPQTLSFLLPHPPPFSSLCHSFPPLLRPASLPNSSTQQAVLTNVEFHVVASTCQAVSCFWTFAHT